MLMNPNLNRNRTGFPYSKCDSARWLKEKRLGLRLRLRLGYCLELAFMKSPAVLGEKTGIAPSRFRSR